MSSRLNGSDNDMTCKYHRQHSNGFPNKIKHQKKFLLTNWIYNSFKMEAKYMKTSYSRAWKSEPFTLEFLEFQYIEDMVMKLQSYTSYIYSP